MTTQDPSGLTLGLFEKRIDGDDCLLELAGLRFRQAGMGTEMHAGSPGQLEHVMQFRPSPTAAATLHLPRDFNLTDPGSRRRILDFATQFAGRLHGMILHDHPDLAQRGEDYRSAAEEMERSLRHITQCPLLFIEYAAGLEPDSFGGFFKAIQSLERISACIDIGHVGIRQARTAYSKMHPGQDVCALKSQPSNLPQLIEDVQRSVKSALPTVLLLIQSIGKLGKPLHFHLHDGHPLSTFSPFGVSDHLSFFDAIPIAFPFEGRRAVPLMFGRDGLFQIVATTLQAMAGAPPSFTLEIHPAPGRSPLGDAQSLFHGWRDKTNAEKMNHWLWILGQNHELLREAIAVAQRGKTTHSIGTR